MGRSEFLQRVRDEMRTRRYSIKTEKSYLYWIRNFIRFSDRRHPSELGNAEIEGFLSYLAVHRKVSVATQNQALCAIMFMYKYIIEREIVGLKYTFTRTDRRMPTVLSPTEVQSILQHLSGKYWLLTAVLYGCGLRINEALRLRIKDVNFINKTLFIFRGKGRKDRYTLLPRFLLEPMREQIIRAKAVHDKDIQEGFGLTSLPPSLIRKYGAAAKDQAWQYVFPSVTRCEHPHDGYLCRHHIHDTCFRKQLRKAVKASGVDKRVTAHTFRHSFATQLLKQVTDIRTVQDLLGHTDLRTTEIYTHVAGTRFGDTQSPFDRLSKVEEQGAEYAVAS